MAIAPTYVAMTLIAEDGTFTPVWQKCEETAHVVVTDWVVSYVDAGGQPLVLKEPYEMTVLNGEILSKPGA